MIFSYKVSWLEELVRMERFCNDGSPTLRTFHSSSSPGTNPLYTVGGYMLPLICEDVFQYPVMIKYMKNESNYLWPFRDYNEKTLVPIHPDAIPYYFDSVASLASCSFQHIMALPSASARTVLVQINSQCYWLKLSYPGVLNRFSARLEPVKIQHSLNISSEVFSEVSKHTLLGGYFFESMGLECTIESAFKSDGPNSIIRSVEPLGLEWEQDMIMSIIPYFSLFASNCSQFKPVNDLWVWLLDQNNPSVAFCEFIVLPLIQSFWRCVITTGFIPEPHAQNVLLAISKSWEFDVIWRDFQGFYIDSEIRQAIGRSNIDSYRLILGSDSPHKRSSIIDGMMWRYILQPLLSKASGYGINCSFTRTVLQDITNDALHRLPRHYLPESSEYWEMPLEYPQYERIIKIRRGHGPSPIRGHVNLYP